MTPAAMPPKLPDLLEQAADESETATTRLYAAAALRAHLDEWLTVLAQHARDAGHTWADLGVALDVTKQAAQKRFGNTDRKVWVYDATKADPLLRPPTAQETKRLKAAGIGLPAAPAKVSKATGKGPRRTKQR